MTGLSDSFQRPINYLRLSVTDRCNLRCFYCYQAINPFPQSEILTYEELATLVRAFGQLGINKVRLTGGEPLLRKDLPLLVSQLANIEAINDLCLTTNGTLLSHYAAELKKRGLRRINVSLDTLRRQRYIEITGEDRLKEVLQGIEEAKRSGLNPLKINVVVMRGVNEDEVMDFARLSKEEAWHIRFIELMPFGKTNPSLFVSINEVKEKLATLGELKPFPPADSSPAKYFHFPHSKGTIGFISPVSDHFCFNCNRLRLTPDGKLRLCLLNDEEVDLKTPLRSGISFEALKGLIKEGISQKPLRHRLSEGVKPKGRAMFQLGG